MSDNLFANLNAVQARVLKEALLHYLRNGDFAGEAGPEFEQTARQLVHVAAARDGQLRAAGRRLIPTNPATPGFGGGDDE